MKSSCCIRDTNIKMLQQQINPHFLYNTMEYQSTGWQQKYGADDISTMVRSLGICSALLSTAKKT